MKTNSKVLSESQVLEKLDIPDFRHLSKDKIMTFFSMLPSMDPEVAKKAIEQFPAYAGSVKGIISEYRVFLEKVLTDNSENAKSHYMICTTILDELSKMLEQEDLSFEEKQYIIDKMLYIEEKVNQKDSENKGFKLKIVIIASFAFIGAVAGLASILGTNTGISIPNLKTNIPTK